MDIVETRLEKIEHLLHGNGEVGLCESIRETRKDVARVSEQLSTVLRYAVGILCVVAGKIVWELIVSL